MNFYFLTSIQKNIKSYYKAFSPIILLLLTLIIFIPKLKAQNQPGKVIKAAEYDVSDDADPNKPHTSDWILSLAEDEHGNFVGCGYSGGYNNSTWLGPIKPALLNVDANLNLLNYYTPFDIQAVFKDPETNSEYHLDNNNFGSFSEVIYHDNFFIAIGRSPVIGANGNSASGVSKPVITKVSSDFNSIENYVLYETGASNAADDIVIRTIKAYKEPATGVTYYFIGGRKSGEWFIAMLDEDFVHINDWVINDPNTSTPFNGEIKFLCLGYEHGSQYNTKPVDPTESAFCIVACGVASLSNNATTDEDAVLISLNFSTLFNNGGNSGTAQIEYNDVFDSEVTFGNSTNYDNTFTNDGNYPSSTWPCSAQQYIRNGIIMHNGTDLNSHALRDWGKCVRQNEDGDFIYSIQANYVRLSNPSAWGGGPAIYSPLYQNEINERVPDDMYACQLLVRAYSPDQTYNGNMTLETQKHVSHASGLDFHCNLTIDHDGDIFVSASTADEGKALLRKNQTTAGNDYVANYMLHKLELDKSGGTGSWQFNELWTKVFLGGKGETTDQSGRGCGFSCIATSNNDILFGGDNQHNYDPVNDPNDDNFELVLIKDDCFQNTPTPPLVDILPNDPNNPGVFDVSILLNSIGSTSNTLTWGSDHVVKSIVYIPPGYKLKVINDVTVEFVDITEIDDNFVQKNSYVVDENNPSVFVDGGAELEMINGSHFTQVQNTGCDDTWGGVEVYHNANMNMENSVISNARIAILNKGSLNANNTLTGVYNYQNIPNGTSQNYNFINNRVTIDNYGDMDLTLQKFINNDAVAGYKKGMDYFIRLTDADQTTNMVRGCRFENTYFDNLGFCTGISSFKSDFAVLFAELDPSNTGNCHPLQWQTSHFEGLLTAIRHSDPTIDPDRRMRVLESDFINNRENITDAAALKSFIYKNDISWDLNYPSAFGSATKTGIFNTWGWGTGIYENEISNTDANNFIGIYNEQNAWDLGLSSAFNGHLVNKNIISENAAGINNGIGQMTALDNTHLQISCNQYINLAQDWLISGNLSNQGTSLVENTNQFNPTQLGSIDNNISSTTSFNYSYSGTNTLWVTPSIVSVSAAASTLDCSDKDPCSIYIQSGETGSTVWDLRPPESGGIAAMTIGFTGNEDIQQGFVDYYDLNFSAAYNKFQLLDNSEDFYGLSELLKVVEPAIEGNRISNLNSSEVVQLKHFGEMDNFTGLYSRALLFHFATERMPLFNEEIINAISNRPSNTNNFEENEISFNVYPNPSTNLIYIEGASMGEILVNFYNMQGQLILSQQINSGETILTSDFSPGVYFIEITQGQTTRTKKLIINK